MHLTVVPYPWSGDSRRGQYCPLGGLLKISQVYGLHWFLWVWMRGVGRLELCRTVCLTNVFQSFH